MAHPSLVTRLDRAEALIVSQKITTALTQARAGTKADFARVLCTSLPGTPTHIWIDLELLRDDELRLVAEEHP